MHVITGVLQGRLVVETSGLRRFGYLFNKESTLVYKRNHSSRRGRYRRRPFGGRQADFNFWTWFKLKSFSNSLAICLSGLPLIGVDEACLEEVVAAVCQICTKNVVKPKGLLRTSMERTTLWNVIIGLLADDTGKTIA